MSIDNLVLEVTRRCNMQCAHCLRGDAQALDMTNDVIEAALRPLAGETIGCLTLSGGEPGLNVAGLKQVLETCKRLGICVCEFYIVTNGKSVSEDFLLTVMRYYVYCKSCGCDDEISAIALSKDEFHEAIPEENETLLRAFSFFREDKFTEFKKDPKSILKMGRGRNFKDSRPLRIYKPEIEDGNIYDTVYVSCRGDVYPSCDLEYDHGLVVANVLRDEDWLATYAERIDALFGDSEFIIAE